MIEITNLDEFLRTLDQWERDIHELTRKTAFALAVELLERIVVRAAQHSGDYASNWKLSVGSIDTSFQAHVFGYDPDVEIGLMQGDPAAVAYAMQQVSGKFENFRLGDTIYISNSAKHDEPYAWLIEDNKIKFRNGNRGATVQRAMDTMRLFRWVGRAEIEQLGRGRWGMW